MADVTKTKYTAQSIAKEVDFTFGESSEIDNLSIILDSMYNSTKDFVVHGQVTERDTPSMNVDIESILSLNVLSNSSTSAS